MPARFGPHPSNRPRRLWLTLAALVVGGFHCILPYIRLLGVGLMLAALLERHRGRITRILLTLALLSILGMPGSAATSLLWSPHPVMRWAGLLTRPAGQRGQALSGLLGNKDL